MNNIDVMIDYLSSITGRDRGYYNKDTRIVHDAGLYGEDFVDYIDWFSSKFSIDTSHLDLSQFSPNEINKVKDLSKYKEITIKMLSDMIESSG